MEKGYLNISIDFDYREFETHANTKTEAVNVNREDVAVALAELVNHMALKFKDSKAFRLEFFEALNPQN